MGADRPIFVLGCPRSGTTLLQLMLHAHPRIAMPPETRFVITAYERRNSFGDLRSEASRRALAGSIVGDPGTLFGDLGLDAGEVAGEIAQGPPTLGSAIGIVFRAYARRFGKPRWGDKRPGYYQYVPALARMFPDAQFVHLIRDGRDCVASLLRMPWFHQDIDAAVCTWIEAIDSGRRAARSLPAGAYYELRYEDLVADPAGQLGPLCAFLGEDYDPVMTEPHKVSGDTLPERQVWHSATRAEVKAAPSGTWQERLEPGQIALCETAMKGRLRSLGYELTGPARPDPATLARYARAAARHRGAAYKRRLRDRAQRRREPGPVQSQV
ncbi:MAG: sulfotransferase family protein [Streptosporangiaceae bacterium]